MTQQPAMHAADTLTSAPAPAREPGLLIDQQLPRYDVAIAHAAIFRAPPATCYRVVRELDLFRNPVIRTLFDLRDLPQRVADRFGRRRAARAAGPRRRTFRINDLLDPPFNWLLLAEEPGVELVVGHVARPWQPTANALAVAPADFAAFDRPGFAKIALSLCVHPYGTTGTILTAETRVAVTDPESLRRFGRYWALVGPFSELIRRPQLPHGHAVSINTQDEPDRTKYTLAP